MDRLSLTLAALLAGCTCGAPAPTPESAPTPEPPAEPAPPPLASTSRTDLGPLTPMVTVEVTRDAMHVSNVALVATWPPSDREALARARPTGDARWPEVEEDVRAHGDDIVLPTLRDAFAHASNVDHARAGLSGTTGTPIAFALRAGPDVPFIRVLQAIYAAGLTGYAEPRLVLMAEDAEVALPLPLPRMAEARAEDVARELGRALASAGIDGRIRPEGEETELAPDPAPDSGSRVVAVLLSSDGLRVTRDGRSLAVGCATESESDVAAIPTAQLAPSAITTCLDAAGEASTLTFRTAPATRYADAVAILETLAARGPVGLSITH